MPPHSRPHRRLIGLNRFPYRPFCAIACLELCVDQDALVLQYRATKPRHDRQRYYDDAAVFCGRYDSFLGETITQTPNCAGV